MGLQQFDETFPVVGTNRIQNSDGTGAVQLVAAQNTPYRVDSIYAVNGDAVDHFLQVILVNGALTIAIGAVNVPAHSGLTVLGPTDILAGMQGATPVGLTLLAANILQVAVPVAMAVGTQMNVYAFGGLLAAAH